MPPRESTKHHRQNATTPQTIKGIVYLDDLTFDRIVTGRDHVLVRFDKEYR